LGTYWLVMFRKLKTLFASKEVKAVINEKDQATSRGEPYVRVLKVHFDENKPGDGYFELEWNQIFVRRLLESGYTGDSEEEIVDQWFTTLCRGISEQDY
jgi:hypothetical protein